MGLPALFPEPFIHSKIALYGALQCVVRGRMGTALRLGLPRPRWPSRLGTECDFDTPPTSYGPAVSPRCGRTPAPRHGRRDHYASWQRRRAPRGSYRVCGTRRRQPCGEHRGMACVPRRRPAPRPTPPPATADALLQRALWHGPHANPDGVRSVRPLGCPTRRAACLARTTRFPATGHVPPSEGWPAHRGTFHMAFSPGRVSHCGRSGTSSRPGLQPEGMATGHRQRPAALGEAYDAACRLLQPASWVFPRAQPLTPAVSRAR